MFLFLKVVFFISAYAIFHTYFVYPALLFLLSRNKKSISNLLWTHKEGLPEIAIVCAAYNEEKVITEKIKSVFKTTYPTEKITFYIGTDACSDNTVELIKQQQHLFPQLNLIEFTERTGKINIINKLVLLANAPLLVMTDANVFFREDTLFELAKHFKNPDVKLVCGNIVKRALNKETVTQNELQYLGFENFLKKAESNLWQLVIGAEGGCYGLRKENYVNIPSHFIADDFFITCSVLSNKGKILFEENAIVYEDAAAETSGEFKRKARIATGNFQNLFRFKRLLANPFSTIGFAYWSHKVLRWLTPFFFLLSFICALLLVNHFFFLCVVLSQLVVLAVPLFTFIFKKLHIKIKLLDSLNHFVVMNFALFTGFIRYCKGVKNSVWQPIRQ